MEINQIYQGNCVEKLKKLEDNFVDVFYLDPPFFTQRKHSLSNREDSKTYEFEDSWDSLEDYVQMLDDCLIECQRTLKDTGSLFLHCDKTASHHLRVLLDKVFGTKNFQSEIVWTYKRWSNAKKGLLNQHQTIFFYSKSKDFKFNTLYTNYSASTNIDQIWQERVRKENGKSAYKTDENGKVVLAKEKKGVPLSDVWEIPFLNPKAKERVGYPTQKPVLLLKKIIEISSDKNDLIIDPFCGSGTTCVATKDLERNFIGIDISEEAVKLAQKRLEEMIISASPLLEKGREKYQNKTEEELVLLKTLEAIPVQRNAGIDGFLKAHFEETPVPVKIQQEKESLNDALEKLEKACKDKEYKLKILLQTQKNEHQDRLFASSSDIKIIKSPELQILELKESMSV